MYEPPVDFSFKSLGSMADALNEDPNPGLRPVRKNSEDKFRSRSLRLNNNFLTELSGLYDTVKHYFSEPALLSWLDLSFNDLSHIDAVICELPELRVLYLHGNSISNLSEVARLGALPFLHTLTMHGNSVENEKGYRRYVVAVLPQLKKLDFSAITRQERTLAQFWQRPGNRGKSGRKAT